MIKKCSNCKYFDAKTINCTHPVEQDPRIITEAKRDDSMSDKIVSDGWEPATDALLGEIKQLEKEASIHRTNMILMKGSRNSWKERCLNFKAAIETATLKTDQEGYVELLNGDEFEFVRQQALDEYADDDDDK